MFAGFILPPMYDDDRRSSERLRAIAERIAPASKVLDFGAYRGFFSKGLAKLGHQVTAVSPEIAYLQGVQVIPATLSPQEVKDLGHFDAALVLSVLHHVEFPIATLEAIDAELVFVEVPHPSEELATARHNTVEALQSLYDAVSWGEPVCMAPGYDNRYSRVTWLLRR